MKQKKTRYNLYREDGTEQRESSLFEDYKMIFIPMMIITTLIAYTVGVVMITMVKTDSFSETAEIVVKVTDRDVIEPETLDDERPSNGVTFITVVEYEGKSYFIEGLETYEYAKDHKKMKWLVRKTYHRRNPMNIEFIEMKRKEDK